MCRGVATPDGETTDRRGHTAILPMRSPSGCAESAPVSSTHSEPGKPLGLLLEDLDSVDLSAPRPCMHEANESVYRNGLSLEHRFDCAVPTVQHVTRHAMLLRKPPHRVTEEHSLYTPMSYDTPADHGRILPRSWSSARS